jgi:hemerythrin-like domain-containing protein
MIKPPVRPEIHSAKSAVSGFDAPAAGFEAPLEMLSACHGRVERQCATLLRLLPHLAANGADRPAREAARNVTRYFETAAGHHHADEEEDLFPALLCVVPAAGRAALSELIAALEVQHRELEAHWRALRPQLEGIAAGTARTLDADEVTGMVGLYRQHIEREETELLPLAARVLDAAQLDVVGRSMRVRRGIKES